MQNVFVSLAQETHPALINFDNNTAGTREEKLDKSKLISLEEKRFVRSY